MQIRREVLDAAQDLRFLLSRGYRRERSVDFVGDRYGLSRVERLILYRVVYDDATAARHRRKICSIEEVRGESLAVDGYNVLITVESLLSNQPVFICDDGVLRDIASAFRKHSISDTTYSALKQIASVLVDASPKEVRVFFDKQVSKSGELAAYTQKLFLSQGLNASSQAVEMADKSSITFGDVVASSDSVILEKADRVVDIPAEVALRLGVWSKLIRL